MRLVDQQDDRCTSSRMIGSVSAPTFFTAMPSASVAPPIWCCRSVDAHSTPTDRARIPRRRSRCRGLIALRRRRDAGDQPAAADRDHQGVEGRLVLQHFQRDGALPGDDERIVVGMHPDEPLRLALRPRRGPAPRSRVSPSSSTQAPCALVAATFTKGVVTGITMVAGNAEQRRVIGDRLGVVAGRHGDDAALALGLGQRGRAWPARRAP